MQGLAAANDNIVEQCIIATLVSMMSRCKRILTNFEKTDLSYTITQFSQICLMKKFLCLSLQQKYHWSFIHLYDTVLACFLFRRDMQFFICFCFEKNYKGFQTWSSQSCRLSKVLQICLPHYDVKRSTQGKFE